MRINDGRRTVDMEERDLNYMLPAYVRSYSFYMKNELPVAIVVPMIASVNFNGVPIPIHWVEPGSPEADELKVDASNVQDATEAEIAAKDAKDEQRKIALGQIAEATKETEVKTSPARDALKSLQSNIPAGPIDQPPAGREAKGPTNPAPPDSSPDNMHSRDAGMQKAVAKDIAPDKPVDEEKEKEVEEGAIKKEQE